MTERHCPKCRVPKLKQKTLSDGITRIDVCPSCLGGWFDATELARVLSVAVERLSAPGDAELSDRPCPKCGIPLSGIDYPETEIEVDVCGHCHGIWLDRGEFRALNLARSTYQDKTKFEEDRPVPANLKEAAIQFVERILIRFDMV